MFWGDERLKKKLPSLITDFSEERLDYASYRLRVGMEAYVSPSGDSSLSTRHRSPTLLNDGQMIVIPPGQFGFLLTKEKISVPEDAIAFISMRSKYKFRGLVNVSGFHVDPTYSGHLVFSVFNASPRTIHLVEDEECFLIWYADIDSPTKRPKKPGLYKIPTGITSSVSDGVVSLAGIKERMDKLSHQVALNRVLVGAALAVIISLAPVLYDSLWDNDAASAPAPILNPPCRPCILRSDSNHMNRQYIRVLEQGEDTALTP